MITTFDEFVEACIVAAERGDDAASVVTQIDSDRADEMVQSAQWHIAKYKNLRPVGVMPDGVPIFVEAVK